MKLIWVQNRLKNAGARIFTTDEFRRFTGMSATGGRKFLLRYVAQGLFWQIRRGLYASRDDFPHLWVIANRLYHPSYISLETALSHYGIIPETIYSITSVTSKITRRFEACDRHFQYHKVKQKAYTGYCPLQLDGQIILVAEPEKALADYLYFVHLGKKKLNDRLNCRGIHKKQVWSYLALFERPSLIDWSRHVIAKQS